ncbi:MAG: beta-ketoacyl-[acyl-carrier-protein] synthase II [Deltaproteobacteria bacterium RIFCSPLOWO2_12_FULL_60_19]|nr:MAG: beta-ketoacyl-[acyl-carrier-protein] synthase II [Deltaproteobacteria bacterium RIFCSPLOWO2_12_FULL_60_19]
MRETEQRRVVVTGVGLVTPLGTGLEKNWQAITAGRSGIRPISRIPNIEFFASRIAGEVPDFRAEDFIEPKEIKKMDLFIQYSIAAAQMAFQDAGLKIDPAAAARAGVIIGVGLCGIETIENTYKAYMEGGPRKVSPFFIPKVISNLAPGHVAIRHGLKGVNWTPTSACASGNHAIGEAYHLIRRGLQDIVVAGGAEAAITPLGVGGFSSMKALSTRNDAPERASRPFDKERDGFVLAEGSGILILEEREAALQRGAKIYAELIGYAANGDAHHMTAPAPEGEGAARCMALALKDAGIEPNQIDYINAHGTSTEYNDMNETQAIKTVFGAHAYKLAVSSTKSMTGHLLGAAGAVEGIFTSLALHHGILPPTINYENPDPQCDLDYVPNQARKADIQIALSNSFGFGGTNACVIFRRAA